MSIPFEVIATGSSGNAVILNRYILIDCGVPFKAVEPYLPDLKLVLLTHEHSDHFRGTTLRKMSEIRPKLRFGCCEWLVGKLLKAGVPARRIDKLEIGTMYGYGACNVIPVPLSHDVPNCGYKIHFKDGTKAIYATDTCNMNGIRAKNYDLYLVEANYEEKEILDRIDEKKENGEFVYEHRVLKWHLSREDCENWIYKNIGPRGEYVFLHQHVDKEKKQSPPPSGDDEGKVKAGGVD